MNISRGSTRNTNPTSALTRRELAAIRDTLLDATSRQHIVVAVPTGTLGRLVDEIVRLRQLTGHGTAA